MINTKLNISILVDNPDSWIIPFVHTIQATLAKQHNVTLCFQASEIPEGDILFLLGCTSIIPRKILQRNEHNFVIHESDLPEGRGWSPISWQVLEGKKRIPIVLFEATEELDAGAIYLKDHIELDGTELLAEIKQKQGEKTVELIFRLLERLPNIKGEPQKGVPTYYPKRTRKNDALDPYKTIIENFNHLRIVDNEKYPAWFEYQGQRYLIKIFKIETDENYRNK
jgi:methionyl-tRNA formyltransferase